MAIAIPKTEPLDLYSGKTVKGKRTDLTDYPAPAWTLNYFLEELEALAANQLAPILVNKIEKLSESKWQARGWERVDPLKDPKANFQELRLGTKSRADILAEQGKDIEEMFTGLKTKKDLATSVCTHEWIV